MAADVLAGLDFGNSQSIAQVSAISMVERDRYGQATSTFYIFFDLGLAPYLAGTLAPILGYDGQRYPRALAPRLLCRTRTHGAPLEASVERRSRPTFRRPKPATTHQKPNHRATRRTKRAPRAFPVLFDARRPLCTHTLPYLGRGKAFATMGDTFLLAFRSPCVPPSLFLPSSLRWSWARPRRTPTPFVSGW